MIEKLTDFTNLEEMFDNGFIQSMHRVMPNDVWDETSYYHVTFFDETERDFYFAEDLLRFANCLLHYFNDNH